MRLLSACVPRHPLRDEGRLRFSLSPALAAAMLAVGVAFSSVGRPMGGVDGLGGLSGLGGLGSLALLGGHSRAGSDPLAACQQLGGPKFDASFSQLRTPYSPTLNARSAALASTPASPVSPAWPYRRGCAVFPT
jgi:hypothetical protein